jgi:hypothetical protein
MTKTSRLLGTVGFITLAALGAQPAFAAGTTAGDSITNTVLVDYQVGGFSQTQKSASDTLTVDRKINLTVAEVGNATTTVSPNETNVVTTFTLTNNSNAVLDFALAASNQSGGTAKHGGTDNFDVTALKIYRETNGTSGWQAGDTLVTFLDALAADGAETLYIVANVPNGLANASVAGVSLLATAKENNNGTALGSDLVETTGAGTAGMDTVFGDAAGSDDTARDAAHSARDDYTTYSATLTVVKSSKIISDPVNGTTNPKFIPGAIVEYCIAVSNASGSATATSVGISDAVPAQMDYYSTYGIFVDGTVNGSGVCQADGTAGGSFGSNTVSGTLSNITASQTRTLRFQATIK